MSITRTSKVSVIIPVFNRSFYLREAVMSVLLQSYTEIEVIIIDDGSTDDTITTAKQIAKKWANTVKLVRQGNSGPGRARQVGTVMAEGEFIQYLDSDDLLMPNKIESQVLSLNNNHQAGICYGISYEQNHLFSPALYTGPIRSTGNKMSFLFPRLLNERWWTTSNPLYRRTLVERIGPWMDLVNEEDWEFDARAGKYRTYLTWIPEVVSIRRINLTNNHLSKGGTTNPQKLVDRIIAKHKIFESAVAAGLTQDDLEMQIFSRECFLLARQSAEAELKSQSKSMFHLSRQAAGRIRKFGLDYIVYELLGNLLGWIEIGKLSGRLRNMLK